jgi:hypothetical protein
MFKEDLELASTSIGYLYTPGSHHTTTRVVPAARLFTQGHKNRLSHGKPVLKKLIHEIQQSKNMIKNSRVIYKDFAQEQYHKICAVIVWNFRSILDRIGELDRPGSFMDLYLKNGPICVRRPVQPPRQWSTREEQILYKQKKNAWLADHKKGYKLLKQLRSHVHEISFASGEMETLHDLYSTFEYKGLLGCRQFGHVEAIRRLAKWIHSRFSLLENGLKSAEKCVPPQNIEFHTDLQKWRNNANYKYLKSFLLKKYIGFYNKNEQQKYLEQINRVNSKL